MMNSAMLKFKIMAAFLSAVVLLQSSYGLSANAECGDAIKDLSVTGTNTLDSKAIDQKIQNLSELKISLDLAKVGGASSADITALKVNYKNKEQALVDYLVKNSIMTRKQLIEKIKQQIRGLQDQNSTEQNSLSKAQEEEAGRREEQTRSFRKSVIDGNHAVFHKVAGGDFTMGGDVFMGKVASQTPVTLIKLPEIMATSMTQIIYKKIAELANARFPNEYKIDSDPSHFKGNTRPVEMVSYEDVELWTKALNELSDAGDPALHDLILGHKNGMHYSGLMTEAQREYLMKQAKTEDGDSIDEMIKRKDTAKLKEYAIFHRRESEGTAIVDQTKPMFIDGKEFYGLNGNVWEWVEDWYHDQLLGGVDPQVSKKVGFGRVIRGGYWSEPAGGLRSTHRFYSSPKDRSDGIGFRLVRIVE